MNKLKDIIYDKNDILIALIIIGLAALIIYTRIGVILDYPAVLAAEAEANAAQVTQQGNQEGNTSEVDANGNEGIEGEAEGNTGAPADANTSGGADAPSNSNEQVTIQIPAGANLDQVGQILVTAGLVPSAEEFRSAIVSAGKDTRVIAGTFTISTGATLPQVIEAITK